MLHTSQHKKKKICKGQLKELSTYIILLCFYHVFAYCVLNVTQAIVLAPNARKLWNYFSLN